MNLTSHEIPLKLNDLPFRITWESSFYKKPKIYFIERTASAVHILKLERYRED